VAPLHLIVIPCHPSSPSDLEAAGVGVLSNVAYHCRVLLELGQIEIVREQQVRGAMEHFYRAINRPLFHSPDWEKFDPQVRRAISSYGVDAIFKDVSIALTTGTFDSSAERHLSRTPMLLDREGWTEASVILDETLDRILEVQAKANGRMTESKEEGIPTMAAMACFEMPPKDSSPSE
jgi:hypothetical protein